MATFLVGGAVRDLLLDLPSVDLDLVVEGDAIALAHEVAPGLRARVVAHARFGTASISGTGFRIDVARARAEAYPRPGALPIVRPASLLDDLARRDFSVNAMALRLAPPPSELVDPFGGAADLKARRVRSLHDRSFQDDATRMLRAARYAARLRFRLAPETEAAIRRDLPYVDFVTGARLRTELRLTFLEPTAVDATELARDLGVLEAIDPHLGLDSAVANRWREALAGERLADVVELGFCLVCICNETADVASISRRLHLTGTLEAALHDLVHARAAFAKLASSDAGPAAVAEALDGLRPASVWAAGLRAGGWARRTAEAYLARWRRARPLLRGSDLLALGVAEGPDVGQLLRRLRASRLEGRIRTREDEIRFVESLLKSGREA